ncbi:DUF6479 family protein [Streptomyces sp. SID10815]|uniref:DUF6479 family protein n=1 Tax=Streptomyces similanensis TaxID=1274988 RepID=A0ABP9JVJ2_9ACTN|nr:DUF6479 family protein [Streptomyces sp. SID10815]NEA46949.1 hypothetical protein [Streptomyces sp. SID10815]QKW29962.1 hypothetical protein HUT11_30450 [Streptomyces seoulensis]
MVTASYVVLAAGPQVWAVVGAFVGGLVIVCALLWAVGMGIGVMRREPDRPEAEEQPRLPVTGAIEEISEMREPDEVECEDGRRILPHELHAAGTRRSDDQHRHRWAPGTSGSFGSGGSGAH